MKPRASIIIPVYNEGESIQACLDRILEAVNIPSEVLVVYDFEEDETVPYLEKYSASDSRVIPTLNTYGPGPAKAIRFGMDQAMADVLVVTMADASDDPQKIGELVQLVENGAVIAAASRYAPGGRQVGGPWFKKTLSRLAGLSLFYLARVGTRDATNSFKAYSREFVSAVGIDSESGFEIGIELVAKARRLRLPVAEVPTTWLDRTAGGSRFRLSAWIPKYLKWYRLAFGPQLDLGELQERSRRAA